MKQICGWLGLKDISRVESYDISNISGFQSVGSMVVFDDGKPKKSDYRKFRIKPSRDQMIMRVCMRCLNADLVTDFGNKAA